MVQTVAEGGRFAFVDPWTEQCSCLWRPRCALRTVVFLCSNPVDPTLCTLTPCQVGNVFISDEVNTQLFWQTWTWIDRFFYVLSCVCLCFSGQLFIFDEFHKYQPISQLER